MSISKPYRISIKVRPKAAHKAGRAEFVRTTGAPKRRRRSKVPDYAAFCFLPPVEDETVGTLSPFMGSIFMGQAKPVILIVEDDELLRLYAAGLLEDHGFGVVEAENADAALTLLETRDDVRLLFTDIQMPGSCDGMDLARKVHTRWPHILLVITSGQLKPAQAEIPDHGRFVGKPYRANELVGEL